MKYSPFIYLLGLAVSLSFIGCEKERVSSDKYDVNGTVYLTNSNTPVANALVRFFRNDNSNNVWAPEVLEEVGSTITDENGRFTIPKNTNAEFVRAYGLVSVFDYEAESGDAYLDGYLQGQGDVSLYLKPPAWVKVKAVDIEPMNPEVVAVMADTYSGTGGEVIISDGFSQWRMNGNIPQSIYYFPVFDNIVYGTTQIYNLELLPAFDTTEVIITY